MTVEDWRSYRSTEAEIKKDIRDEVHEFLTKVFNVYMVNLPISVFKQLDVVRDKLIALTIRFVNESYEDFCISFSKVYRSIIANKDIQGDVKNVIKELADRVNTFFTSRGMYLCVKELKYNTLRVKVLFNSAPLSGATVVVESEGNIVAKAETDGSGLCVLEVPEGRFSVYVYKIVKDGEYIYEEKAVTVPVDSEVVFDIKETKTATEIAKERGGKPLIKEVS